MAAFALTALAEQAETSGGDIPIVILQGGPFQQQRRGPFPRESAGGPAL